jgi:iron complex transport system substrate-binding protein
MSTSGIGVTGGFGMGRHRRAPGGRAGEGGFTLIELLVVVVILGVLAGVVVFSVSGINDKGEESALRTDARTLVSAQEAHCAQKSGYASESGLVTAGLLSNESVNHDIVLNSAGRCGEGMGSGFAIECVADAQVCAAEGITVVDSAGVAVTVPSPPQRVVCLVGACEDVLAALGATDRMVIRSVDSTNTPAAIAAYGTAGIPTINSAGFGFQDEDLEQIAAADPDLVIGLGPFQGYLRPALEPIAPFFDLDIGSYQMAITNLYRVGQLLGLNEAAEAGAQLLRDQIDDYADLSPRNRTPIDVYPFFFFGIEILADSTESQGGSLWATQGPYPWPAYTSNSSYHSGGQITFDLARVAEVDPDAIFIIRSNRSTTTANDDFRPANPAVWDSLAAVRNGRVYEGPDVKSWPWATGGTISAKETLDRGMKLLYPEVGAFPLP